MLPLFLLLTACPDPYPAASEYCELSVDLFCDYYLRCGRMAADSLAECEASFLETCNEVYEPRYADLEQAGLLQLSRAGLKECERYLSDVECDDQLNDLQGDCAQIWQGLVPVGGGCGIGIGSFVCDEDSTCVVGLDLCGTCVAYAAEGEVCDADHRCLDNESCTQGTCVQRGLPGDSCADDGPCMIGTWCEEGVCTAPAIVEVGDPCGATERCPYSSACLGGECVQSAALGESCADRTCASGWCDDGTCAAFKDEGEPCAAATECLSGVCDETCGGLQQTCPT